MSLLITSAFKAFDSIFVPGMFGVFIRSLIITLLALAGFVLSAGWGVALISDSLAWFLFPGIMPVIVNFFDERITGLIETHHYPQLPPPATPAFYPELMHDIRFSVMAIALNIAVLPLYLFPPFIPFVFLGLNGYLLGNEFFIMVAKRRMPLQEAKQLRKRHSGLIWTGGAMMALLATIPFLNLIAPFWGIALMTHLYHKVKP
jgi:CysZ protein